MVVLGIDAKRFCLLGFVPIEAEAGPVATTQCLLREVAPSHPAGNVSISILARDEEGNAIAEDPQVMFWHLCKQHYHTKFAQS